MGAVPRVRRQLTAGAAELGRAGEKVAAELLQRRGYEVIGTGFTARRGEIDLVCRRGRELVIVEVKTRTTDAFGTPAEAVGPRKRRALAAAAAEYRLLAGWRGPIRYAVVGLVLRPGGGFDSEIIEDPFE
ncbi:MAG TPA: YraN family protein [Candidatus Dormibacteraeota bacterium]|nr:YraN family protein [Candidatus Dormibacteraeota bacterium]